MFAVPNEVGPVGEFCPSGTCPAHGSVHVASEGTVVSLTVAVLLVQGGESPTTSDVGRGRPRKLTKIS